MCLFWGHNINLFLCMKSFSFRFTRFMFRTNNPKTFFFRFYRPRNFTIISLFRLSQQFSSLFSWSDFHILRDNFHLISWNRHCKVFWHPYLFLSCQLSSSLLYLRLFELRMPSFYIIIPWAIFFNAQFLAVNINSFFFYPLWWYYPCLKVKCYWFIGLFWAIMLISTITKSHPTDIKLRDFLLIFFVVQFLLGRRQDSPFKSVW